MRRVAGGSPLLSVLLRMPCPLLVVSTSLALCCPSFLLASAPLSCWQALHPSLSSGSLPLPMPSRSAPEGMGGGMAGAMHANLLSPVHPPLKSRVVSRSRASWAASPSTLKSRFVSTARAGVGAGCSIGFLSFPATLSLFCLISSFAGQTFLLVSVSAGALVNHSTCQPSYWSKLALVNTPTGHKCQRAKPYSRRGWGGGAPVTCRAHTRLGHYPHPFLPRLHPTPNAPTVLAHDLSTSRSLTTCHCPLPQRPV